MVKGGSKAIPTIRSEKTTTEKIAINKKVQSLIEINTKKQKQLKNLS